MKISVITIYLDWHQFNFLRSVLVSMFIDFKLVANDGQAISNAVINRVYNYVGINVFIIHVE